MADTTFIDRQTPIYASWLNDVNDATYNGTAVFTPAGSGATASTVQEKLRKTVSVTDFGAVGNGVTDDSVALQKAIDYAASIGAELHFPPGKYLHATTLVFKNLASYHGPVSRNQSNAASGAWLWYTGTSDQAQINNTVNATTAASILIEGLSFWTVTRTAGKANLVDLGSSFIEVRNCFFGNADWNIILDQTEVSSIHHNNLSAHANGAGCLWLVNGAAHTVGASGSYTNQIQIYCNQIGYPTTSSSTLIALDGGANIAVYDNNLNGGGTQIRCAGATNLTIRGNEMEACGTNCIALKATQLNGTSYRANATVVIDGNFFVPENGAATEAIFTEANCGVYLQCTNNFFSLYNGGPTPFNGSAAAVVGIPVVVAYGNIAEKNGNGAFIYHSTYASLGFSSAYYVPFNNYAASSNLSNAPVWNPTWGGTGVTVGNATVSGTYTRNGNQITATIKLTYGSTSAPGTGQWTFSLPAVEGASADWTGSALIFDTSAGTYYRGIARILAGASYMQVFTTDAGTVSIKDTVPITWATGDTVIATITYCASAHVLT